MFVSGIKKIFPFKLKRKIKDHLGVPSLHWSLLNLKKKNFYPKVIYDIGAYEGLWSLDVLEVFPSAKVLMIEAQKSKETFLQAIKQSHSNVDYSISLLSSEDGIIRSFAENETASHIVIDENPRGKYLKIEGQALDKLIERKGFPFPDLLKLDVQGHEMEVLKGAEKSLSLTTVCLLEITLLDLGEKMPLMAEMLLFMDKRNFQAYDISHFIRRPFDKALFQIDMFFVKKDSYLIADRTW